MLDLDLATEYGVHAGGTKHRRQSSPHTLKISANVLQAKGDGTSTPGQVWKAGARAAFAAIIAAGLIIEGIPVGAPLYIVVGCLFVVGGLSGETAMEIIDFIEAYQALPSVDTPPPANPDEASNDPNTIIESDGGNTTVATPDGSDEGETPLTCWITINQL